MFSYLELDKADIEKVIAILYSYIATTKSNIVKVNAMQTLADLAQKDESIKPEVVGKIKEMMGAGGGAIQARGRRLLVRLGIQGVRSKQLSGIIHGLFVSTPHGGMIYVNREHITEEHLRDFQELLGVDITVDKIIKFVDGHETFHALIDTLRSKGVSFSEMDETEEEHLSDIFGKAFALGVGSIDEDLLEELESLSKKLGIDLKEVLEDKPQQLEAILAKLGISVTVTTATPEEMAGIKADADRQEYTVRTAQKPGVPQIVEIPRQRMAVIYVKGDPNVVCSKYLPALYTTAYGIKKILKGRGINFAVAKLRARWPGDENLPKDQWLGLYALPIPNDTVTLPPQDKVPGVEVKMEDWEYGTAAEILHQGPYTTEGPTIEKLRKFIEEQGYQIVGEHEEEYIKGPLRTTPEKYQTIIRYRIKKAEDD